MGKSAEIPLCLYRAAIPFECEHVLQGKPKIRVKKTFGEYVRDRLAFRLLFVAEQHFHHCLGAFLVHRKIVAGYRLAFYDKTKLVVQRVRLVVIPQVVEKRSALVAQRGELGTDIPRTFHVRL